MVLKDEVLKGLRFELSGDEIRKIYKSDSYEKYHKTNNPKAMIELVKSLVEEQLKQYLKILDN